MNKQIKAAIIIRDSKQAELIKDEVIKLGIDLTNASTPEKLANTEYFDVVLVHENELSRFDRERFPESEVILLTENKNKIAELFPRIKDQQIFTILSWPCSAAEVVSYLNKAYEALIARKKNNAQTEAKGKSIVVTSFSNGVGKTVVAYNLTNKLTQFLPAENVALIDMNVPFSNARALLNLQDNYTWQSIKPILQEGTASKQKIQNVTYLTKYGFTLLSGPSDYASATPLVKKEFQNLETSMRAIYGATVIDWHTIAGKTDLEFLSDTDLVLVVIDMNSNSVLQAMRALTYIRDNNSELMHKMRFVLNRIDQGNGKTAELVASKLELKVFGIVDNDPDAINAITENGELFADKQLLIDTQYFTLAEAVVKELY